MIKILYNLKTFICLQHNVIHNLLHTRVNGITVYWMVSEHLNDSKNLENLEVILVREFHFDIINTI